MDFENGRPSSPSEYINEMVEKAENQSLNFKKPPKPTRHEIKEDPRKHLNNVDLLDSPKLKHPYAFLESTKVYFFGTPGVHRSRVKFFYLFWLKKDAEFIVHSPKLENSIIS